MVHVLGPAGCGGRHCSGSSETHVVCQYCASKCPYSRTRHFENFRNCHAKIATVPNMGGCETWQTGAYYHNSRVTVVHRSLFLGCTERLHVYYLYRPAVADRVSKLHGLRVKLAAAAYRITAYGGVSVRSV